MTRCISFSADNSYPCLVLTGTSKRRGQMGSCLLPLTKVWIPVHLLPTPLEPSACSVRLTNRSQSCSFVRFFVCYCWLGLFSRHSRGTSRLFRRGATNPTRSTRGPDMLWLLCQGAASHCVFRWVVGWCQVLRWWWYGCSNHLHPPGQPTQCHNG